MASRAVSLQASDLRSLAEVHGSIAVSAPATPCAG